MSYALRFTLYTLLIAMLSVLLPACEPDNYGVDDLAPVDEGIDCLYKDCVTGMNDLVVGQSAPLGKSEVPLAGLQRAFFEEFTVAEHIANFEAYGFPAWDQLLTIPIDSQYRHYLVPVYQEDSDRVQAVISYIHYLHHGMARVTYLTRDAVPALTSYYGSVLEVKNGHPIVGYWYPRETAVMLHSFLDYSLFGEYKNDLFDLLPQADQDAILQKDCKTRVRYEQETCWYTYVNGNLTDIDCNYTYSWGWVTSTEVGCGGGNPTPNGGTGSIGTGGGGGPTVGGPGTLSVLINTDPNDPNNRCIEDGVGCDDEDDENDENDALRIRNRIDEARFPCAHQVLDEIFSANSFVVNDISNAIFNVFGSSSSTSDLLFVTTSDIASQFDNDADFFIAGFYVQEGSGQDANGNVAISGTIFLDENALSCSADFNRATILHEGLHAFLDYQREVLSASDYMDQFPLRFLSVPQSMQAEHFAMAQAYVDNIFDLLVHYNPTINEEYAMMLAWAGLDDTPAYEQYIISLAESKGWTVEEADNTVIGHINASSFNCNEGLPPGRTLADFNGEICD